MIMASGPDPNLLYEYAIFKVASRRLGGIRVQSNRSFEFLNSLAVFFPANKSIPLASKERWAPVCHAAPWPAIWEKIRAACS